MEHRIFRNHLRAHRKHWKLSEEELARLLGGVSASLICRIEKGTRKPTGPFLLGCEVLFGVKPRDLFPALFQGTQEVVIRHAAKLSIALEGKVDRASIQKRELLDDMISRVDSDSGA